MTLMKDQMDSQLLTVSLEQAGMRLDKFLAASAKGLSRNRIQQLLEQGHITRNGKKISDASGKVKADETYEIFIPPAEPSHIEAQDIPLDIIYEDEHLLVVNKPPGLTVHPAPGHRDGTLVNALLAHCGESLSGIGGIARPGLVHRLDKDTSGLLVVAKTTAAHHSLSEQIVIRAMKRTYLAVVWGVPKKREGTVEGNISRSPKNRQKMAMVKSGGKHAVTHYTLMKTFSLPPCGGGSGRGVVSASRSRRVPPTPPSPARGEGVSLIECRLETGRTHQIRVHMTHLGHPLIGDQTYGRKHSSDFPRQALHAFRLEFIHPATKKKMKFEAPMPEDLSNLINQYLL